MAEILTPHILFSLILLAAVLIASAVFGREKDEKDGSDKFQPKSAIDEKSPDEANLHTGSPVVKEDKNFDDINKFLPKLAENFKSLKEYADLLNSEKLGSLNDEQKYTLRLITKKINDMGISIQSLGNSDMNQIHYELEPQQTEVVSAEPDNLAVVPGEQSLDETEVKVQAQIKDEKSIENELEPDFTAETESEAQSQRDSCDQSQIQSTKDSMEEGHSHTGSVNETESEPNELFQGDDSNSLKSVENSTCENLVSDAYSKIPSDDGSNKKDALSENLD